MVCSCVLACLGVMAACATCSVSQLLLLLLNVRLLRLPALDANSSTALQQQQPVVSACATCIV
jgi:hypothetical protein